MMAHDKAVIPCWDGNPSSFEEYVTAAKWYHRGTKTNERDLVVARLWGQLHGAAKSVVRYLEPDQYEGSDGLDRFLEVLRASPLQQLPICDSFVRLEKWHSLRRTDKESIPELIVREEELFTELQQSLMRARRERHAAGAPAQPDPSSPSGLRNPPSTPSQSPMAAAHGPPVRDPPQAQTMYPRPSSVTADFFEDELRGYRLLRASRLSQHEKQNILVQTSNSTSFNLVRRALRTLYAEESEKATSKPSSRIWFEEWDHGYEDAGNCDDVWWSEWDDWAEWSPSSQTYWYGYDEDWGDDWESAGTFAGASDDLAPDDQSADPQEQQLVEAFNIASEANRTLRDAREAVRKVRQSRGYYSAESNSGKGIVPSASPASSPSSGKATGKTKGLGPCFICGMKGHTYMQCPDRFAKGGSKGKSKFAKGTFGKPSSWNKGKGKSSKSQGKAFFLDLACILSAHWDASTSHGRAPTRAIIDTGASENAIGLDSLHDLVHAGGFSYEVCLDDQPTFRFGNGHRDQAVSRADITGTSLGSVSFYVLGGLAKGTPPLIGARTLRGKNAMLSYSDGCFKYHEPNFSGQRSVQMQALTSGHITIDLSQVACDHQLQLQSKAPTDGSWVQSEMSACAAVDADESPIFTENCINMFTVDHDVHACDCGCDCDACLDESFESDGQVFQHSFADHQPPHPAFNECSQKLQQLASRLEALRAGSLPGDGRVGSLPSRRLPSHWVPMLLEPQAGEAEDKPVCNVDGMFSMRPSTDLCDQEPGPWERSPSHARTQFDSGDHGDVAVHGGCPTLHRASGERQDDGAQRPDAASRNHSDDGLADDLRRVHGEAPEVGQGLSFNDAGIPEVLSSGDSSKVPANSSGQSCRISGQGHHDVCSQLRVGGCRERTASREAETGGGSRECRQGDSSSGDPPHGDLGRGVPQEDGRDGGTSESGCQGRISWAHAEGQAGREATRCLRDPSELRRGGGIQEENQSRQQGGIKGLWDRLKQLKTKMASALEPTTHGTPNDNSHGGLESVRGSRSLDDVSKQPPFELSEAGSNPLRMVHAEQPLRHAVHYEQGVKFLLLIQQDRRRMF